MPTSMCWAAYTFYAVTACHSKPEGLRQGVLPRCPCLSKVKQQAALACPPLKHPATMIKATVNSKTYTA